MRLMPGALALLLATAAIAAAETDPMATAAMQAPSQEEERSPWQFEIVPYLWISGAGGTADVKGRTASFDIGPGSVIDLLFQGDALAGAGFFSARYERVFGFVDAFGAYMKDSVGADVPTRFCCVSLNAVSRIRPVIIDVAAGYQLGEWTLAKRLRPVSLGAYVGMRYTHFGIDLDAGLGAGNFQHRVAASREFNWADPLIGLRGEIPVFDRLSFAFRGDVGGFGVSSDLIWGVAGDLRYWLHWSPWSTQPWVGLGWRIVGFDREFDGNNSLDMRLSGPTAALGFVF
jgi:hypothetical protein